MSIRLLIKPEAEADFTEAFQWYQQRRDGLGLEFLLAYEAILGTIRRLPDAFPDVHR